MNEELRIVSLKIRGSKGKEDVMRDLRKHHNIMGIQETWLRQSDPLDKKTLHEEVRTTTPHERCRGYGGIGLKI